MRTNLAAIRPEVFNSEGVPAVLSTPHQELRRAVAACLLWEDGFYESGQSLAERIKALVPKCSPAFVAACACDARTKMKLRHVPLLLVREMARASPEHRALVGKLLPDVIQRADELAEFLSIYWLDGKEQPLSKQVKVGLARAFSKFGEHQLAKYNRDGAVKLRDVLFLAHPKPKDAEQDALWKKLIAGELQQPDTWEVSLSGGADKRATFERLMAEEKLGALAYLRNLRNMREAGISEDAAKAYAGKVDIARVLPFRFIAAARAVPAWEGMLEHMMLRACEAQERLSGRTLILLDISPSMHVPVSAKSAITRMDTAFGVAILLRELCESVEVMSFSIDVAKVPPRRGFALADAIKNSQPSNGTMLGNAVAKANVVPHDRLIVLTDEESQDPVGAPTAGKAYMINVASSKNAVGYGRWTRIDGWSEAVIDYVREFEKN